MVRVILGLIKGAIVGGGVGFGLLQLGWLSGFFAYVACALVGAVVGLVAGRAPWKAETIWTPVVKMVFGALVGIGLCAAGFHLLPDPSFKLAQVGELHLHSGVILAPLVGILYGIFVEVDDGGGKKEPSKAKDKPTG
jgi:hypothetical protein